MASAGQKLALIRSPEAAGSLGPIKYRTRITRRSNAGDQELHKKVRAATTDYMAAHPDQFRAFLGSEFEMYLESMRESGVWGDELTLVSWTRGC